MPVTSGPKKVLIGIQARSTSKRFPGKVFERIGRKTMLEHVLWQAHKSAQYLNKRIHSRLDAVIMLLVPHGDSIVSRPPDGVQILEGPEDDVLTRYVEAAKKTGADYIVRITADCPLIPPWVISKHVLLALDEQYDYLANVYESFRTAPDGFDCEVMSAKLLAWLDQTAKPGPEREHVTQLARLTRNEEFKRGAVSGFLFLTDMKLSVDTYEDLQRVRMQYEAVDRCTRAAHEALGYQHVHRI